MNYLITGQPLPFHGYLDSDIYHYGSRIVERSYRIIQKREVQYQFYLHQHPYVSAMMQRLLRKGTAGLQAIDTEYNTRVQITNNAGVVDSSGKSKQLAAGEVAYLTDGANATWDGKDVRFGGGKVIHLLDEALLSPEPNDAIMVRGKTRMRRINGEVVTLNLDTPAQLVDGSPVPILFSDFFASMYDPNLEVVPDTEDFSHPVKNLDFTPSGAYSVYNWELFYHIPIIIAIHLSKNQRYAEAQRWFHYLFDPTDDSDGPTPERFWKVLPFQETDVKKIEEVLVNLATGTDAKLRNETIRSIEAWKDAPFRPHVIARYRQQSYMYKTVMAYLDNLIAWGDALFRQDTGEAIDEAMQLYVLAANILGPRPLPVPRKGTVRPQTYANLRQDLDKFGNVMRDVETDLIFDTMPFPTNAEGDDDRLASLRSLGKALYFCVPRNDKLLGYWDTVADRLFKIRNSLNIQGVFRRLALFEPPIDPAMLARAAAAGLDVGAIVNGLNQPLPLVRFSLLVQRASEIVQEVKALGNNLLSAMEKEDGEAMALLRAQHERVVFEMVEHVRYGQLQEAIKSREGLLESMALAVQRYTYFERQMGKQTEEIEKVIPELDELDMEGLGKMKLAMQEPSLLPREIGVNIAQDLGESGGKLVSTHEALELTKLAEARDLQDVVQYIQLGGQAISLLPQFGIKFHFWGLGEMPIMVALTWEK